MLPRTMGRYSNYRDRPSHSTTSFSCFVTASLQMFPQKHLWEVFLLIIFRKSLKQSLRNLPLTKLALKPYVPFLTDVSPD